jgi:hypothetical protein
MNMAVHFRTHILFQEWTFFKKDHTFVKMSELSQDFSVFRVREFYEGIV